MSVGRAFRAQLVVQGQRELFDYWRDAAGPRRMPARSDLDPLKVPRLLPSIGLLDLRDGLHEAAFRLAGTRLHEVYGQEITGKRACEVFSGECRDYWRRVHERVVEQGEPAQGVVKGPADTRDHVVLFWLRLPLSEDGGSVDRMLCYDIAGPAESGRQESGNTLALYRRRQQGLKPSPRQARFG